MNFIELGALFLLRRALVRSFGAAVSSYPTVSFRFGVKLCHDNERLD